MERLFVKGCFLDYRSRLLQEALEEKKKLGLDESHVDNVRHSSALQALQCYGLESSEANSSCEIEETVYGSSRNERHKTGDLPKQTMMTSSSKELQSLASNSFGSNSAKDGKPLKSILKKTENLLNRVAAGNKPLPCNSNINMPFFLNNAENEDEFLYGKSVNEQSVRVQALYAKNKHNPQSKLIAVGLNARNLKTHVEHPGIERNNAGRDLCVSANNKTDFTQGSYSLADCSGHSETKCGVSSFNSKVSSDLSGYAALVNFSSAKSCTRHSSNNISKDITVNLHNSKKATYPSGDKEGPRISADLSANSRSKKSVTNFDVQNPKKASDLSSYAALLSFSKTGHTNMPPKMKNVSSPGSLQKEGKNYGGSKTNSPAVAHDDLMCSELYGPDSFKSPTRSPAVANTSPKKNLVSVSKQAPNLLPRSIQKLQMKKTVAHSVDKKDVNFEPVAEKAAKKGIFHNSSGNDLLKNVKVKNCDVKDVKPKPKNVEKSLKKDELLLLTYVQTSRNLPRRKIKSDQTTKPVFSGGITNSDCKPIVKTCAEKPVSLDKETKYIPTDAPETCSIENMKAIADNASAIETTGNSSELKNKSGFVTESVVSPVKPDWKSCPLVEIPPRSVGRAVSEMCKKGTRFPNRKKEFLSKLSSIKQKKNNSFYYRKKSHKELHTRRPVKRPRNLSVHENVHGRIVSKGSKYSRVKHFCNFDSGKTAHAENTARNAGEEKIYSFSPEINACGRDNFYSFDSEKGIGGNSSDHNNKRRLMLLRPNEILSSDNNLTVKSFRKYSNPSLERLSASGGIIDGSKKGRHEAISVLRPKRHSLYVRHSHDTFGRNPQKYSRKSNSPSHSLDWSPLRDGLDSGSRCSVDLSPPRCSFDVSPKRQQHLDRGPSRRSFKENCEIYPFDKSSSPHSFSRSPVPYSCARSPNVSPFRTHDSHRDRSPDPDPYDDVSSHASSYVWSPDLHLTHGKCDSDPYDRSPDYNSRNKSPVPLSHDGSPVPGACVRSLSPHYYGGGRDLCSRNQISSCHSYDDSSRPELGGQNSGICSQEMSLKRHSVHKGHELHSFENSHVTHTIEMSPRRLSRDRSPERISVDISLRKLSRDRSMKKFSVNESHRMHSNEWSPRRLSSEREPRKKSFDVSLHRSRKSRIDSYHSSPDRTYHKGLHKECESLKHSFSRSTESVTFDSSSRFTERTVESNHSDSSQNLSSGVSVKSQQLDLVKPFVENCNEPSVEKIPSSLYRISQPQKQNNIRETNLVIPDVNKIVNAIDALASNYNKSIANEKIYSSSQGFSSQSFDSTLNIKDPGTYTSDYNQSIYSHTGNNSQFPYNSEFPQTSYPQYSVASANSCLPDYVPSPFSSQTPDKVTPYQAESSDFQNTSPASVPYSNTRAAAEVGVQGSLCGAHRQCDAGGVSSTLYNVYASSPHTVLNKPCSATGELSEIFRADESNCIANDVSLKRVTTLTTVPLQSNVLSEKNSSKSQSRMGSAVTMKFITPDKIEKLLRQKSEIRKQIGCLNDEYEKLQKMQGDALRRKRREKDGHKDLLLLEYGKLQDEIKSHLSSLVGDISNIEEELKNGFLGCTSNKENGIEPKKFGECNEESEDSSVYYEFYDSGSHWCKPCNKLCTTVTGMLEHLKSDEHLEHISEIEKPWYSNPTTKKPIRNEQKGQKIAKPLKGIQFIMPVDGFYCSLCKEYFEKKTDMQKHLESLAHFEIYQNYTAENPTYERQWLMEKLAGLSVIEIEDRKVASKEDKPLQRKQKKEKEKLKWRKEEEKAWLREEEERFIQGREEQLMQKKELMQTVEERMDVKETMKHKVKKKHTGEEEQMKEGNFQLRMDLMEQHRKQEKQGSKYSKEHGEEVKCTEKDELKLMSYRKQDTLKRKKGKENETSNKIRIVSCAQEAEKSDEKLENRGTTDNCTLEKQSVPEAKWTVCYQQKKLPLKKGSEPKSKPTQTVVYIGRAPNFKSHNKGNSSFRANLLKLALQKKEASMNLNSAPSSTETGSNCVSNVSSSVVTSTSSETVQHSCSTEVGSADAVGNNAVSMCSSPSSGCEVKQKITHSQSSSENVTSSGCVSVLSTLAGNIVRSTSSNDSLYRNSICAPNQQSITASNTSKSDFVPNFQNFKSDGSSPQENCGITVANAKHSNTRDHIHGPLTEEDDDYRVLGINREDRLPLVLPKPPPAALIWPCYKDDTSVSDELVCNKSSAVTSDSDAQKNYSVNCNTHNGGSAQVSAVSCSASIHQDPITSTSQAVENSSNLLDSQQSFSFTYGINTAQQQNVNYSTNVQSKMSAPFASFNGTHTSSVHQSYTYPYSSNTCGLTTFQENFVVPDESNMSCFPAAQVPSPMHFRSLAPRPRYSCQPALPPDYHGQRSINFYAGRYPQNQLPSPNVNPQQNYTPVFQKSMRFHAQMFRGSFKNKWHTQRKMQTRPWLTQRKMKTRPGVDTKEKKELISQVKTEEPQVLDNTGNEKLVTGKAANIEGCASDNLLEGSILQTDSSSDTSSTSRLESVKMSNTVENTQKSFPIGSQGVISDRVKSMKENAGSEQNQVPPEDVSVTDCGISNNQDNVHSNKKKTLSSVTQSNNSQQHCEAATAGAQNSATAFMIPVSCSFYDTSKLCENTLSGANVIVDQGASQQNQPCELKIHEGTRSPKSEKHHLSPSDEP